MCLLEAHAQVRVLKQANPSLALLSGKEEEPTSSLSPAELSLSLRVPCLNQQWACCLEDVLLGDYSKTRRGTSHKSACSWVFFWWCWSLPMLRSTLLFRYISSLGDVHFDWRITSMEELWERDNTCFSYGLAKESLVIQRTEMPQTNGCVK